MRMPNLKYLVGRHRFGRMDVETVFTKVYEEGWWGDSAEFDSGEGSVDDGFVIPYVASVVRFIEEHGVQRVVDLGCGDFQVGRRIVNDAPTTEYIGVDIVRSLIARNRRLYEDRRVKFIHANLISDPLPTGDLALVRQVLQHLSNAEIATILRKFEQYRYVLVTEHLATGKGVSPNRDKAHGPDVRANRRSGVFIELPPFSLPAETLFETPYSDNQILRTSLIQSNPPATSL
jgi:SAM-dependent methyltransferase